jgi:S-adenosylmethionine decarboxylase
LIAKELVLIWLRRLRSSQIGPIGGNRFSSAGPPAVRSLVGEDGMRQNALLRSGKGLGPPGTARKRNARVVPANARSDHFVVRNGVRCAGVHLIIDVYEANRLDDIDHVEATLRRCVDAAGATLLHVHVHHFQPNGVSGVAVLAESHISIHTWPEAGYAALDVFMCGKADPDKCVPVLREAFGARRVAVSELVRGQGAQ